MLCSEKKRLIEPQDEEAFITIGPLHPCPQQPPRWMGFAPPVLSDATPTTSNGLSAMNRDVGGPSRWQEQVAPRDPEM